MTQASHVTIDDVPHLIEIGTVERTDYMKAVSFLRDGVFWKRWALIALFALAVGHILSGIIFFFAFNWNDLSGMMKFAVVGCGIFASLLGWVLAKLDTPMGQALGISATVLVGVMFAVLGQVYQTPAMIHTPFVFWAILTLPIALASRNLAHWTVWIVIFTVAISAYANSGLRLAGSDTSANLLNIAVSGGFIAALILLDKILAPRLAWARAEWFRVLLVLGAVGFAFFGFTESFWGNGSGLWGLAIGLSGALLGYLYFKSSSLATLSLASFGIFTLVAQFGFKVFDSFNWDVGTLFLVFLWLGGLTIGLVAAFRHYVSRFKKVPRASNVESENGSAHVLKTATEFSEQFGLERDAVAEVLTNDAERDQPWYMGVFLAIAGVLTALLGCLFFGSLLGLIIGFDDETALGVLGILIFGSSIFLRRKTNSPYVQHMLNTMIVVGGLSAAIGFGIELRDFDAIIVLLLILSAIVLALVKDRILEFLSAAAIITLIGMELYHLNVPMVESIILVIATAVGLVLLTQPIGKRLYNSAGTAFLMAPAILGIALVHGHRWNELADSSRFSDDWPARLISLLVLLGGVAYLNRGKNAATFKPPLTALIPLVIAAAFVPLGGASALLLMLAGYILGSKSLAMIGTLLQIYFLTMFYYDLSLDLLTKSIILFVSGVIFLGVWVFVRRKEEAAT